MGILLRPLLMSVWMVSYSFSTALNSRMNGSEKGICSSAGNNFSLFRGYMSFQIFLLVGHLTNWTGHNLLTDNTLKKRTQDVLVTCSVIVSNHNVKVAGHFQNLVGQCHMTGFYFQHCAVYSVLGRLAVDVRESRPIPLQTSHFAACFGKNLRGLQKCLKYNM